MKSLFVGNLSFSDYRKRIKRSVQAVRAGRPREPGEGSRDRPRAGICVRGDAERRGAAKAVAGLDGKQVGGRNLKVNEARPKEATRAPRSDNRGGGNRERFSNEDYREAARQPREPRW